MAVHTWALGLAMAAWQKPSTLIVVAESLRSPRGALLCALYDRPEGFPDRPAAGRPALAQRVPIDGRALCIFGSLAPGTYALAVLHDENDNGRMDTNLLGMPREGWGVSGSRAGRRRRPRFSDSTFVVAAGRTQVLRVPIRYP